MIPGTGVRVLPVVEPRQPAPSHVTPPVDSDEDDYEVASESM